MAAARRKPSAPGESGLAPAGGAQWRHTRVRAAGDSRAPSASDPLQRWQVVTDG